MTWAQDNRKVRFSRFVNFSLDYEFGYFEVILIFLYGVSTVFRKLNSDLLSILKFLTVKLHFRRLSINQSLYVTNQIRLLLIHNTMRIEISKFSNTFLFSILLKLKDR